MSTHLADNRIDLVAFSQANNISHYDLGCPSLGLEEQKSNSAVLTLLENGMILQCSETAASLLGCASNKLIWQPVSRLFPQLSELKLILDGKVNPYLKFLSATGHQFEVLGLNGMHFASELFFNLVEDFGKGSLRVVIQPVNR